MAAAISAIDRLTMKEHPPIMVQLANADDGPPVYMIHPNSTGMPEMKFIDWQEVSALPLSLAFCLTTICAYRFYGNLTSIAKSVNSMC